MDSSVKVTLKQDEPMTVVYFGAKGGMSRVPAAFNKLYSWIREKGYKAKGPAMLVYYDLPGQVDEDDIRWELRSQITDDLDAMEPDDDGFGVKHLRPGQVAAMIYKGPYEKIEETFMSLRNWISENGYEINGPYEEFYLNISAEPEELITELRFPVQRKGSG